jgi:DNA-directed RNA polymerase
MLEANLARDHLLVQDANDTNSLSLQSVKHYVLPLHVSAKPWTDCIAGAAYSRVIR